ncbi:uncharacterized protein LOC134508228 isoform X2 [Chroicocephalus ridibundus]|uniref:uncharacterized protein LOC134508228 isoform X2 n=1 Tax=Chroicocephalus ridibundus TaxID=1192867 RepID=UPI002FDDACED
MCLAVYHEDKHSHARLDSMAGGIQQGPPRSKVTARQADVNTLFSHKTARNIMASDHALLAISLKLASRMLRRHTHTDTSACSHPVECELCLFREPELILSSAWIHPWKSTRTSYKAVLPPSLLLSPHIPVLGDSNLLLITETRSGCRFRASLFLKFQPADPGVSKEFSRGAAHPGEGKGTDAQVRINCLPATVSLRPWSPVPASPDGAAAAPQDSN